MTAHTQYKSAVMYNVHQAWRKDHVDRRDKTWESNIQGSKYHV